MIIGIYDPKSGTLEITSHVSLDNCEKFFPYRVTIPKDCQMNMVQTFNTKGKILVHNDPDQVKPWERKVRSLVWPLEGSLMAMNLDLQEKRVGAVVIHAKGKNQYKDEHSDLLLMLHDPLAIAMSNALKHQEVMQFKEMLADDNRYLHQQLLQISGEAIIGSDSGLNEVMEKVRQVAQIDRPVLLLGETGVGKEVIANAIHQYSDRQEGPFIKVNCGAIPETLMDSELFGHEKGAFTGAINQKRGRFERANNGTIFLDEIGELSLPAQVRLLRVIHNKEIERVGGTSYIPINTRIISATHRNLAQLVEEGRFREDLWFRLNVFPIMIPPLRDRKADIPELVYYFIKRKTAELKIHEPPPVDPDDLKKLMVYHWPGNIRELENIVERALIQSRGGKNQSFLNFEIPEIRTRKNKANGDHDNNEEFLGLEELNRIHIQQALKLTRGKVHGPNGAACLLRLNPSTLIGKMRKLGIAHG